MPSSTAGSAGLSFTLVFSLAIGGLVIALLLLAVMSPKGRAAIEQAATPKEPKPAKTSADDGDVAGQGAIPFQGFDPSIYGPLPTETGET